MWRAVRDELGGAWRSLRYDLRRRPAPEPSDPGGAEYDAFEGGPRRVLVSSGMAALVLGGAVGGYFGVVNGMEALLQPRPATAPQPAADGLITAGPVDRGTAPARRVPATPGPVRAARPAPPAAAGTHGAPVRHPKARPAPNRRRPPVPTPAPSCSCVAPPAPVPSSSSPAMPTPTPSVTPTPEPGGTGGAAGSGSGSGGSARPHAW